MFTPAINASSTSAFPLVIIVNAFWTHVMSPPFLNLFPFAEATTTGLADLELVTVGACPKSARGVTANVNPPATVDCMKRRLFMRSSKHETPRNSNADVRRRLRPAPPGRDGAGENRSRQGIHDLAHHEPRMEIDEHRC